MNAFRLQFEAMLNVRGWTQTKRGSDTYWVKPDEPGVLYDTAEAVGQVLEDRNA